jgi:integrase
MSASPVRHPSHLAGEPGGPQKAARSRCLPRRESSSRQLERLDLAFSALVDDGVDLVEKPKAECVRLVNACEPAFRNLVRGALLTGCRYSELTGMHVADFNTDAGVITVRESKAGKPRHAYGYRWFRVAGSA